jgi:hypothetical protein
VEHKCNVFKNGKVYTGAELSTACLSLRIDKQTMSRVLEVFLNKILGTEINNELKPFRIAKIVDKYQYVQKCVNNTEEARLIFKNLNCPTS